MKLLHDQGLKEIDIPKSTGLLYKEPLFTMPYSDADSYRQRYELLHSDCDFQVARDFYDTSFKFPGWSYDDEEIIVGHYINKVCQVSAQLSLGVEL